MTGPSTPPSAFRDGLQVAVETLQDAETAWLTALTAPAQDGLRRLMHPDCVIVHGAVGHISTPEEFLRFATRVGTLTAVTVHDVAIQRFGAVEIVSCLQESRIAFVPDITPFVIQAAVTRVWVPGDGGRRLLHMQMARRQPPG